MAGKQGPSFYRYKIGDFEVTALSEGSVRNTALQNMALNKTVRWGPWRITARESGLMVRAWRPGDRLAGRTKKIQDVFVDAKIPRSEREAWPLVVRGDEVVAVPGIVEAEGIEATRE